MIKEEKTVLLLMTGKTLNLKYTTPRTGRVNNGMTDHRDDDALMQVWLHTRPALAK